MIFDVITSISRGELEKYHESYLRGYIGKKFNNDTEVLIAMNKCLTKAGIRIPSQSKLTNTLTNLMDLGFIFNRKTTDKKTHALYYLHPKFDSILTKIIREIRKEQDII